MNSLKFRVWDKKLKLLGNVSYIDFESKKMIYHNHNGLFNYCVNFEDVEIMQSTGLFDKYGVEIYEGDIVIDTVGPQIKMVVKWIDDCAAFRIVGTYEGENFVGYVGHETKFGKNTCQVIGNIYENKELLR